jgi:putative two-component system response regulator
MLEVPEAILGNPGKLSAEEYKTLKAHTSAGTRILQSIDGTTSLSTGARWHHERYDGSGYPDGLTGKDIPEEARIIAVADAYDAMRSARPYRAMLTREEIRAELERGRGVQFDPGFAGIVIGMLDEKP